MYCKFTPLSSTQRDAPIEDNSSEELERPPKLGNQDTALFDRAHPGPNIHTSLSSFVFSLCFSHTAVKKETSVYINTFNEIKIAHKIEKSLDYTVWCNEQLRPTRLMFFFYFH